MSNSFLANQLYHFFDFASFLQVGNYNITNVGTLQAIKEGYDNDRQDAKDTAFVTWLQSNTFDLSDKTAFLNQLLEIQALYNDSTTIAELTTALNSL